jgi:DNA-binding PadR family transcriptional regulator
MTDRSLSAVAVLALSSLAEGARHGYAIMKDVAARSGGEVAPGATSLYRTLWQLRDDGLVAESSERPEPVLDDERRRYFRITPAGRRALAAELARLERLVAAARPARHAGRVRS